MVTTATAAPAPPGPGLHPRLAERDLLRRTGPGRAGLHRWLDHTASARGCARPIRLSGQLHTVEKATGEILGTRHTATACPDGVIYLPCGDRRASVCPACAETYRADTYHLIRAGITGGKGIPETVASHPAVFATLTAPSFGPVHTHLLNPRTGKPRACRTRRKPELCPHGRPLSCRHRHSQTSPLLGQPLCLDCYDHTAQIMWNAWAGELWRRTLITLNRHAARLGAAHHTKLRVSYAKVAEYQHRGVVHFHALLRIDAPDPTDPDMIRPPPAGITTRHLEALLRHAATTTQFVTPTHPGTGQSWPVAWGPQLDTRHLNGTGLGTITPGAVAGYLAKYATKSTEPTGLPTTTRLTTESIDNYSNPRTHLGRLIRSAWTLGTRPKDCVTEHERARWRDTYGRLRRWAHTLGFGGHFATKSRRYSTTHTRLRAERRTWRRDHATRHRTRTDRAGQEDTTLLITHLTFAGIGWHTTADAELATAAATRAREQRQTAKEERTAA